MHILNLLISATVHAISMIQLQFYPDEKRVIWMRSRHFELAESIDIIF